MYSNNIPALFKKIKKYYRKAYKGDKYRKHLLHAIKVYELCEHYVDLNGELYIDKYKLYAAALLHDIAKKEWGSFHHIFAIYICEDENIKMPNDVEDIIYYHKGKKFKPKKYKLETAILRMCDKLEHLAKDYKYKDAKKCIKSYKKIRRFFKYGEFFEDFKSIFHEDIKNIKNAYNISS